jgi:YidC/Oxa1 family membrane protein insertase
MSDNRNTIIAILISAIILIGWQFYEARFAPPPPPPQETQTAAPASAPAPGSAPGSAPVANGTAAPAAAATPAPVTGNAASLEAALGTPRIKIKTPSLDGSIALKGARIDNLTLSSYHETPDPASPPITLLSPPVGDGKGAYFAEFGWVAAGGTPSVPTSDTVWTADRDTLTPGNPVTLTWDNGQGLRFSRVIAIDDDYMFTITDSVANAGDQPVSLKPYADISRWGTPALLNYSVLHEGPVGVLDGSLVDKGLFASDMYKQMRTGDPLPATECAPPTVCHGREFEKTHGGWLGFTDKYWATVLIPDQNQDVKARMFWHEDGGVDRYQTDWLGGTMSAAPGANINITEHLFAGAKVLALLDAYGEKLGIDKFHLMIDFGLFRFLTLPLFKFLRFIHAHIANFGLAILMFTVCVRIVFFPIANRSYQSMAKMKKLQPEVKKLQARYADDRSKLNQEMMALYKREKANPVSGCLPLVIQIPVFFALYKVLFVTIEMRQAPFWGWIKDLSAPDPTTIFNLFGLIPWDPPLFLHIGAWPLIYGTTMYLQQKLNPTPPDPVQARMFTLLPIVFTFLFAKFPAGLVIYWAWSNCLSIFQQWLITRRINRPRTA